jgi:glycogen debranching enzyme
MKKNETRRERTSLIQILLGATLGAFLSILALRLIQYLRGILRQPRLVTRALSAPSSTTLEGKAAFIAAENLRAGIEMRRMLNGHKKLVLNAGWRSFREPWARDFGFASFGLIALQELEVTRQTLEAFMIYQRPTGQFPVKIHATSPVTRYLHSLFKREQPVQTPIKPKYVTGHNTLSLDGNALLVIAALNYVRLSQDHDFVRTHWESLRRALLWLEEYALERDGLLNQGPFADWADSIARQGRILYTNIVYWKALEDMAEISALYRYSGDYGYLSSKARQLKGSLDAFFWRPKLGYFVTHRDLDNLSSAGNLLAVAWGLATLEQAHSILDAMRAFNMASPVPTRVVHRPYHKKLIALENRLARISNYHTDAAWLWLGSWHVIALTRSGRADEAIQIARQIAEVVVRDGEVHEVYGPDGHYISNLWYTSEAPLTWSAGMVVYAFGILEKYLETGGVQGR